MLSTTLSRLAVLVVLAAGWCALVGCKPATSKSGQSQASSEPSVPSPGDAHHPSGTAELTNFLRSNLPPVIRLLEVKNDPPVPMPNTAPGSNVWLYNVRLTLAPTEDELGAPPPQETQAFQAMLDELNGLVAWSQTYAKSPYASLYPGFTMDPPVPTSPQLLVVTKPKGRPLPAVYGKMAAEWQVDHWLYSVVDMAVPQDNGRLRSAYTGPVLIQGDTATTRFVAAAKAAIAQAKPKQGAIERAYRDDLLKATQPGTLYKGQIGYRGKTLPAEVRFTAPPGGNPGLAQFELRLPTSGYVYTCSAKLAKGVPNMPVPATHTDNQIFQMVEPDPVGDLTVNYESITKPKLNLADDLANELLYSYQTVKNVPLNLRNHQLQGKLALMNSPLPGIVLSAQQSP